MQEVGNQSKYVVITGVAQGIGKVLAENFKENGYVVLGIDKQDNPYFKGDLTKRQALDSFIEWIEGQTNRVDCIINNAGYSNGGLDTCDYEAFNEVLMVGLSAPFYLVQRLRPKFSHRTSIINIASTRAFQSQGNYESYSAIKGGIIAMTHAMAVTLSGEARVNAISPGWIDNSRTNYRDENATQHPAGRVGKPEDILELALFLASEKSSFITGENIIVDGGMSHLMVYHGDEGWRLKK